MTYSYDPSLADNISLVRFHVGDNNENGAYLADEEIQYFLTETTNDIGETVVACIRYIITQLSSPDFKKDWLTVSNKEAREGYEKILKDKAKELGVNLGALATASISSPYRADSYQDSDDAYDGSP